MTIKPHCMGMAFPTPVLRMKLPQEWAELANIRPTYGLPSAADLDAVAEEQRIRERTK